MEMRVDLVLLGQKLASMCWLFIHFARKYVCLCIYV